MALQIRRGTQAEWEANNSNVVAGEPAIAIDTGRLFVGTDNGDFAEFANVDNVLNNANGAVATANLADGAVTTAKIADASVTPAKLNGVIDNTLSVSGKAGDAKATGDGLAEKVTFLDKEDTTVAQETQISFPNDNKVIDESGNIVSDTGYAVTDYIDLTDVTGIYRTGQTIKFMLWRYAFYDENHNLLSVAGGDTNYDIVEYNGKQVTWLALNPNAKYVRISWGKSRAYEYYVVKNVTAVASYTLPPIIINSENIYDDAVDGKEAKSIIDEIAEQTSVNIFDPDSIGKYGYYFDYTDGTTHVSNSYYQTTPNKIPIDSVLHLYVYSTFESTSGLFVLFYNGDTYLGYRGKTFNEYAVDPEIEVYAGATHIRVQHNTNATGSQICIEQKDAGEFVSYAPYYVIKESAMPEKNYYPLYGKVIANFGDSIFGNKRPPYDVSTSLANITGATVYNLGFGGCRMSQHSAGWDAFCMYRLADAIATNDFSYQNAVNVDSVSGMPQYFKETRTLLESIDFSKVDIITISYGTNDFTAGVTLDDPSDPDSTITFCGALRYSLEKILPVYPQLHVFVCTPTYRFWLDSGNEFLYDSDTHEISGQLLTDFVEAVQTVSKEYHLKSIDNYYDLGIDKFNRANWFPANDGTHHNQKGGMLIAQHLANEMF